VLVVDWWRIPATSPLPKKTLKSLKIPKVVNLLSDTTMVKKTSNVR
jgi:hypothetical protein